MTVLIVENNPQLGALWARHVERLGLKTDLVHDDEAALGILRRKEVSVIVLNVMLEAGGALAIADYASYRFPQTKVVFVTSKTFFSDGSIFNLAANACAYLPTATPPEDLAAMVQHYAARG